MARPRKNTTCSLAFIDGDGAYFANLEGKLSQIEKAAAALLKAGLGGSTKEERKETYPDVAKANNVCRGVVTCVANTVCTGEPLACVHFEQRDAAQVDGVCCLLASSGCPPLIYLLMRKRSNLNYTVANKLACAMLRGNSLNVTLCSFDLGSRLRLQAALQRVLLEVQQLVSLQTKAALKRLPVDVVKLIIAKAAPVVTWDVGRYKQFTVC
jgi:hypothetical protein